MSEHGKGPKNDIPEDIKDKAKIAVFCLAMVVAVVVLCCVR